MLLEKFKIHLAQKKWFTPQDTLVLGISGGVDSVVLAHLLTALNCTVVLAHCNFKLRGADADADARFCEDLAKKIALPIYVKSFETKKIAQAEQKSIQVMARELRYAFFDELALKFKANYVLTAHHKNDDVETVLMNFCKSNVLWGIAGIPEQRNLIIRPLLPFAKDEIVQFAQQNGLEYRDDQSNLSAKYQRNLVRLAIVPKLQELNPSLLDTFSTYKEQALLLKKFIDNTQSSFFKDKDFVTFEEFLSNELLMWVWMKEKGFTWTDFTNAVQVAKDTQTGKRFISKHNHEIWTNNLGFFLQSIPVQDVLPTIQLSTFTQAEITQHNWDIVEEMKRDPAVLWLDALKVKGKLSLRKWQKGDRFKPFGMSGYKKISDFLTDIKLNKAEKLNTLVVHDEEKIIWVVGYRSDERVKIHANTIQFWKISLITK